MKYGFVSGKANCVPRTLHGSEVGSLTAIIANAAALSAGQLYFSDLLNLLRLPKFS
jgi:hypothetical protein